ncbi:MULTISPECIES: hypothetical protein [unclassified Acinetobacter]|uniref:hypothetical protein n=1 Tax=unclassified Acinetobacter TaxID=196816 RepID=UPI0022AC0D74|nr:MULTISPECIES: hypothetical protein [unclassified Acinetobacter]WAU72968.1 hypothetical protein O1450_12865 [Acinetobacter sp. TR11]WAU76062.1 hypothetical protein O1449_12380 [Acinetobacter sp. TR3]
MSVLRELIEIKNEIDSALSDLNDISDDITEELVGSISFLDEAQHAFKRMIKEKRVEVENAVSILDRLLDLGDNTYYSEWNDLIKQVERDKETLNDIIDI